MIFSLEKFAAILYRLAPSREFLVAYSGGLDSRVLLHSITRLRQEDTQLQLRAIHINHHLHPDAQNWQLHCQQICEREEIEFLAQDIEVVDHALYGIEAAARTARYAAFQALLKPNECLLTAHQQNDQAETVLLQLFRGAGAKGLAAMPAKMPFGSGYLLRPLLAFTRDALQRYAVSENLQWIEDSSNRDPRFNRNYLRYHIMPLISNRWPSVTKTLARSATNLAETNELLKDLAEQDFSSVRCAAQDQINISELLQLTPARQFNVLRYWLQQLHLPMPSRIKMRQLQRDLLYSRTDAMPCIRWLGAEVRRYQNKLYAMPPLPPHDSTAVLEWNLTETLQLPSQLGELQSTLLKQHHIKLPNQQHVTVRFRQGGERLKLKGRQGSHSLKKLFQEWKVPPWQRDRIPLLYWHDQLISVIGYAVAEGYNSDNQN